MGIITLILQMRKLTISYVLGTGPKHRISINSFTLTSHFQGLVDLGFGSRPSNSIFHDLLYTIR